MARNEVSRPKIFLSIVSGFMLSAAFPKIGADWLAWVALVPLLLAIKNLSVKKSFHLGLLTGYVHFLTLVYWLIHTMKTFGNLPLYVCIPVLFLLCGIMALYVALFSASLTYLTSSAIGCLLMVPVLWVSFEYLRALLFTGFPWELLGYSQYNRLTIIQIADLFGVYGVSFLIALANSAFFLILLYRLKSDWHGRLVTQRIFAFAISTLGVMFIMLISYGTWRISTIDRQISLAPSKRVAVVQGNIDQAVKWDPAFQISTTKKYIQLSVSAKNKKPDLVVWPETATPFYFLYNIQLSNLILKGIRDTESGFLIGSPSFVPRQEGEEYYNSAYLLDRNGKVKGKYNKAHLVPFGEYVPLKKWLPFVGKMVQEVGDFQPGQKGATLDWGKYKLGIQICYEIIFPGLSRAMVQNDASLLVNITNDAWYGRSSMPYQHFSMAIFRALENRRALVRSANTGISGFIDPVGRVIGRTQLFKEAVLSRSLPLLNTKSIYTRVGDLLPLICLIITIIAGLFLLQKRYKKERVTDT